MAQPRTWESPLITRDEVLTRAASWLAHAVPYSQTSFHTNAFGSYRTDCSGYVSMAWALPPNRHGGLDTLGLADVSDPIAKDDLAAGDVLLRVEGTNLTRHVAIFVAWADETRTAYWGFEQAGGIGATSRVIAYPYEDITGQYRPHRYTHLI
jgi:cell wall-associated NlpC family hydrolase